jgi:hemoglobin
MASAISLIDKASSLLPGRTARTASWFMLPPPNPCQGRQYSRIRITLEEIDPFHGCSGDKIPARSLYLTIIAAVGRIKNLEIKLDSMKEKPLYERLGGAFAIALVVNRFSDEIIKDARAGETSQNPQLKEWSTKKLDRMPGLKFMRTLWVCDVAGGPMKYEGTKPGQTRLSLEEAHRDLRISPEEFDAVAEDLANALDYYHVPEREKGEVLAAFAAHKEEVNAGYFEANR